MTIIIETLGGIVAGAHVTNVLRKFMEDIQNVDQNIKDLYDEAKTMEETCKIVNDYLKDFAASQQEQESSIISVVESISKRISACEAVMEKLYYTLNDMDRKKRTQAVRALRLHLSKTEINHYRDQLRDGRQDLQIRLLLLELHGRISNPAIIVQDPKLIEEEMEIIRANSSTLADDEVMSRYADECLERARKLVETGKGYRRTSRDSSGTDRQSATPSIGTEAPDIVGGRRTSLSTRTGAVTQWIRDNTNLRKGSGVPWLPH